MRMKMVCDDRTLRDVANEFLALKKAQKVRERTLSDYKKYIDKFLAQSQNTLDVDVLKIEILEYFADIPKTSPARFNHPYTLEALFYGAALASMFVIMMLWFGCYNKVLTSDKFTCLFGNLIPSISLLLVMVFRMVPNFIRKTQQIIGARKSIGKGISENATTKEQLQDGGTVLGALTSWALEGSVVTGDSMRAHGYGTAKRSSFMIYRMTITDCILLAVMLVLIGATIVAACLGQFVAEFVPAIQLAPVSWGLAAYTCYLLIPSALHIKEAIQWHISRSKI